MKINTNNRFDFFQKIGVLTGGFFILSGLSRVFGNKRTGGNPINTPRSSATPYIGELGLYPYNFAPSGWMECSGQSIQIADNTALFSLLGTTYGGDGVTTFNLPDLRGRGVMGQGSTHIIGESGGVESVPLTAVNLPVHTHNLASTSNRSADSNSPVNNYPALDADGVKEYSSSAPNGSMNSLLLNNTGGSQVHDNIQPFEVLRYCISLFGIFPPHS